MIYSDYTDMSKLTIAAIIGIILLLAGSYLYFNRQNFPSLQGDIAEEQRKDVEDYFVEKMGMSREEAKSAAENGVEFRVSKDTTLMAITGNLHYYRLVDNEENLLKRLREGKDITPGSEGAIKAGSNTIETESSYQLTKQMTDEEIAQILLNEGKKSSKFNLYNYTFMPGGRDQ